ncbi:hypothetical protein JCM24511_09713 [Saitozyma sp. JCM 24511]|nr:hypothetical protein JCM24511_09713 [Saitozyma sp. JCM 24511]
MLYWHGFNLRAVVAFVCGIISTLPGFIRVVVGTKYNIPIGASNVYSVVWPVGVVVAATVYGALNLLFAYRFCGSFVERSVTE